MRRLSQKLSLSFLIDVGIATKFGNDALRRTFVVHSAFFLWPKDMQMLHSSIETVGIVQLQQSTNFGSNRQTQIEAIEMAYSSNIGSQTSWIDRIRFIGNQTFTSLAERRARNKVYRIAYRELASLTDRELNDLGIARADISRIAREAAAQH